ncbi:MAG: hypothetical protein JNK73_06255 [Bacteroidia bacterium]|nr:hypothetical protein [Bacteroidia bacterium]
MQASKHRNIVSGEAFDTLFPRPLFLDPVVKRGATVNDTVRFIPKVVRETLFHTERIAALLKGKNTYETCRNIWLFVYKHIAYKKDEEGKEQIRSPARTWHDRGQGVDCDCYTVFICSILSNLKIKHKLRITKYRQDHFQHIYPIVPSSDGRYITVDCVVDQFNYEEPYSEKQDTNMDLEYLNGIPSTNNVDVQDLMGWEELNGDLGKLKILQKKNVAPTPANKPLLKKLGSKIAPPPGTQDASKKGKLKTALHKGLHVTNRVNPATVLLREGILVSMKTNLFKVAEQLKYSYMSDEQAKAKEVDMAKFQKLKAVRAKLEKIFYDAGGKPENLKKAILSGKGNADKEVSGLGYIVDDLSGFNDSTSVQEVLGTEMVQDENLNGLGVVATTASVTAATGVIGAIAGLLKSIGSIFPKKTTAEKKSKSTENTSTASEAGTENNSGGSENNAPSASRSSGGSESGGSSENNGGSSESSGGAEGEGGSGESNLPAKSAAKGAAPSKGKAGFWDANKKWIKPTAIGLTGVGLIYLGVKMMKSKPDKSPPKQALSGFKPRKKKKGGKKHKKKQAVAYM